MNQICEKIVKILDYTQKYNIPPLNPKQIISKIIVYTI